MKLLKLIGITSVLSINAICAPIDWKILASEDKQSHIEYMAKMHQHIWRIGGDCKASTVFVIDIAKSLGYDGYAPDLSTAFVVNGIVQRHTFPIIKIDSKFYYIETHKTSSKTYNTIVKSSNELASKVEDFDKFQKLIKHRIMPITKFNGFIEDERLLAIIRLFLYENISNPIN